MKRSVWCLWIGMLACGGIRETPVMAVTAEDLLWGGADCRRDRDCASGFCSAGLCMGYLGASTEEARERIGPVLGHLATRKGPGDLLEAIEEVVSSAGSDEFIRARAVDALRWLPPDVGRDLLERLEGDPSEPVRFFAARSRLARGDPRGRDLLREFTRHPSEAVRILAERALETVSGRGTQGPISQ